jgi:hypothetical protein
LIEFGNPVRPRAHSVLYLRDETREAVPQYISGRTSYLQVRLAFHRYPQLIRAVFNRHRFGPPSRVSGTSPWPWVGHLVSGLLRATCSRRSDALGDSLSLWLRDAGPLNLRHRVTRRFILQKARRHPIPKDIGLRLLVGNRFQVLFHSPPGVLFTFPSRYWCTIGGKECLAWGGGPPEFPQDFSCPAVLGCGSGVLELSLTGLSPSLAGRSSPIQIA